MKVILDKGCRELDAPSGRRYRTGNGVYNLAPSDARSVVKLGGAVCSMAGTARQADGYRCQGCGFGSFFTTCSRCGETAEREQ